MQSCLRPFPSVLARGLTLSPCWMWYVILWPRPRVWSLNGSTTQTGRCCTLSSKCRISSITCTRSCAGPVALPHSMLLVCNYGRLISIHLQCWEVLPFLAIQRQRCIKFRVLRAQDFYTPLALNLQKGQHSQHWRCIKISLPNYHCYQKGCQPKNMFGDLVSENYRFCFQINHFPHYLSESHRFRLPGKNHQICFQLP